MRPKVIIYNAISLDGRIDSFEADVGLYYRLAGTWGEDATLVGSATMFKPGRDRVEGPEEGYDPPERDPDDARPLLVVPDSRGRVRGWNSIRSWPYWRDVLVLVSRSTPKEYIEYLRGKHVEHVVVGRDRVDLKAALELLAKRHGVRVVRVDSGGTLNGALLREGLVDEVSVLLHPALVGGTGVRPLVVGPDPASPEEAVALRLTHVERQKGGIVWLRYKVVKRDSRGRNGRSRSRGR